MPATPSIRPVRSEDAAALADLLNAIIAAGGTTALEEPFSPELLDEVFLTGPEAVSYTHLDVYKRQALAGVSLARLMAPHETMEIAE